MEDRLSQLPDEVLVSVLSKLTLKEAVLTSCLSSQWRYIWTCITRLNFDIPRKERDYTEFCRDEVLRHISWVNHVCTLYNKSSSSLEEFAVCSPFNSSIQCEVDKWLKFALSKNVQSLKIELTPLEFRDFTYIRACLDLKRFHDLSSFGFKNLKVLTLEGVNIDSQVVKILLSRSPLLEQLSIRNLKELKHLEIGPSLKLKHLEIYKCYKIDYIEICNVNLVSFNLKVMTEPNLYLHNVSSVINIEIAIDYGTPLSRLIDLLTTKFTQLVKLSLEVDRRHFQVIDFYQDFPKFYYLKWLILTYCDAFDITLLKVTPLLQASPYLQMFEIKIIWGDTRVYPDDKYMLELAKQSPYEHLKVIRYEGYLGGVADKDFIDYLLRKSLALEKFIVSPYDKSSYTMKKSSKVQRRSRSRARKQLQGKFPEGVELVIL